MPWDRSYAERDAMTEPIEIRWPRWLRENLVPVDHVAYSYLVYDVPLEDLRSFLASEANKNNSPLRIPEEDK
jgi:hypothetical protein